MTAVVFVRFFLLVGCTADVRRLLRFLAPLVVLFLSIRPDAFLSPILRGGALSFTARRSWLL